MLMIAMRLVPMQLAMHWINLKITTLLEIDNESDGVFDGGHQNQNLIFLGLKLIPNENNIDMGQFRVNDEFQVGTDETNIGETNVNGIVEGIWLDDLLLKVNLK